MSEVMKFDVDKVERHHDRNVNGYRIFIHDKFRDWVVFVEADHELGAVARILHQQHQPLTNWERIGVKGEHQYTVGDMIRFFRGHEYGRVELNE